MWLSRKYPRYGYRRIRALLMREGWKAGRKFVQRIRRLERLERPVRSGFLEDAIGGESWSRVEGRCDAGPDAGEECDDIESSWMLDV